MENVSFSLNVFPTIAAIFIDTTPNEERSNNKIRRYKKVNVTRA